MGSSEISWTFGVPGVKSSVRRKVRRVDGRGSWSGISDFGWAAYRVVESAKDVG